MNREKAEYFLIRFFCSFVKILPYPVIHFLGKCLGNVSFFFLTEYRKRALSNLALASDLHLSKKDLIRTAKKTFQNLAINCLEYPKLAHNQSHIVCVNPEIAQKIHDEGIGIIFFCGHQSNWETLFLEGTMRMKGVAIGKSTKNKYLYKWVLSIREKNGGKIISQKNAVREGIRALRKGIFLGILGDQGMPNSNYSYPFMGRRAFTSTAPALLSYKTNSPIIVATTKREKGKYQIHYSDPIWPDLTKPAEEETPRLMNAALSHLENSIKKSPGEWLWQHNRYKQQTPKNVYKRFRKDSLLLILPENNWEELIEHLPTFRQIYPTNFLFLLVPYKRKNEVSIDAEKVFTYREKKDLYIEDYRFKLVFNFTDVDLTRYYQKLSAFEVLTQKDLFQLAKEHLPNPHTFSDVLKRSLCRPGSLWREE